MTGQSPEIPYWSELVLGAMVTVVKLAPDGAEAARYPGEIVATEEPGSWAVVRATWTYRQLEMDGLTFSPGDTLLEWFSPEHPFNAFAIYSPSGELRGWYANVTQPAYLLPPAAPATPPLLIWHDLYIDLVGLPDGTFTIRDRDELEASPLPRDEMSLYARVLAAGDELCHRFIARLPPFADPPQIAITHDVAMNSSPDR